MIKLTIVGLLGLLLAGTTVSQQVFPSRMGYLHGANITPITGGSYPHTLTYYLDTVTPGTFNNIAFRPGGYQSAFNLDLSISISTNISATVDTFTPSSHNNSNLVVVLPRTVVSFPVWPGNPVPYSITIPELTNYVFSFVNSYTVSSTTNALITVTIYGSNVGGVFFDAQYQPKTSVYPTIDGPRANLGGRCGGFSFYGYRNNAWWNYNTGNFELVTNNRWGSANDIDVHLYGTLIYPPAPFSISVDHGLTFVNCDLYTNQLWTVVLPQVPNFGALTTQTFSLPYNVSLEGSYVFTQRIVYNTVDNLFNGVTALVGISFPRIQVPADANMIDSVSGVISPYYYVCTVLSLY